MNKNLTERRKQASLLSGGTSDQIIKAMVINCLMDNQAHGSLLDFGAGKGELLKQLAQFDQIKELAGIDLFERPDGLPAEIAWFQHDLNQDVQLDKTFDVVVSSETIEHLENPRHVLRAVHRLLKPGGMFVLTMPNQESIRSYAGLLVGGHFTSFLGDSYPAHITALLRMDLDRICAESGFQQPRFFYTNQGGVPKMPQLSWQSISFGLLKGRLFSDNLGMVTWRDS